MRDFKFRVWQSHYKQMLENPKSYEHLTEIILFGRITVTFWEDDKIMQYVGKKDCTGKEIYEGDIILVFKGPDYKKGVVKYVDTSFDIYGHNGLPLHLDYNAFTNDDLDIKVLGNIYENPESWRK